MAATARAGDLSRFVPPPGHHRRSAVLLLFGEGPAGPDVLLTERAAGLRAHPGQVAFPGGRVETTDAGPAAAAVREAREETGLDEAGVVVTGTLPDLYLPVSDFAVTPVLAWWRVPSPVDAVDRAEVAAGRPGARRGAPRPRQPVPRAAPQRVDRPRLRGVRACSSGASPPASSTGSSPSRAGSGRGAATGSSPVPALAEGAP